MESIKKFLSVIPIPVYVIGFLLLLVGFWWFSDDIGSWWENRQRAAFDAKVAEKQAQIDDLTKQRDAAIQKAQEAEAREQAKIMEADLLKQEAAKHGVNVENAQKQIDAAVTQYQNDQATIDKVKNGEISKYDFCLKQCDWSAEEGYPCIPNKQTYCEKFK